jgi:hypothetical protein
MALEENNRSIDQITENRHNCAIYNSQTKEHGVFGYATNDKFGKKLIRISHRKNHVIGGACLIYPNETDCVDMDFISLAVWIWISLAWQCGNF